MLMLLEHIINTSDFSLFYSEEKWNLMILDPILWFNPEDSPSDSTILILKNHDTKEMFGAKTSSWFMPL